MISGFKNTYLLINIALLPLNVKLFSEKWHKKPPFLSVWRSEFAMC